MTPDLWGTELTINSLSNIWPRRQTAGSREASHTCFFSEKNVLGNFVTTYFNKITQRVYEPGRVGSERNKYDLSYVVWFPIVIVHVTSDTNNRRRLEYCDAAHVSPGSNSWTVLSGPFQRLRVSVGPRAGERYKGLEERKRRQRFGARLGLQLLHQADQYVGRGWPGGQ